MENAEKLKLVRNLFRDIFTNTPELSILTVAKLTNLFRVLNPGGPDDAFSIEVKGVHCYDQENADMVVEFKNSKSKEIASAYNEAIIAASDIIERPLSSKEIIKFKELFLQHEADIYGKINYGLNVDWVERIIIQIKYISETIESFEFVDWVDLVISFNLNGTKYHIDIWSDYFITDDEGNELDA